MEILLAAAVAVLFGCGTYLILRPNLLRVVMGFGLFSNGTNLLLIAIGGFRRTSGAPFVGVDAATAVGRMDPLPPDIILTAIVISFAVSALMLTLCSRVYHDHRTDDPEGLPRDDDYTRCGTLRGPTGTEHHAADEARGNIEAVGAPAPVPAMSHR